MNKSKKKLIITVISAAIVVFAVIGYLNLSGVLFRGSNEKYNPNSLLIAKSSSYPVSISVSGKDITPYSMQITYDLENNPKISFIGYEKQFSFNENAKNMLLNCLNITPQLTLTEESQDISRLGFDNPSRKIDILTKNNESITILIGDKFADSDNYFVKDSLSGTIYCASYTNLQHLLYTINDLRKVDLFFNQNAFEISKIGIKNNTDGHTLEFSIATDSCYMSSPFEAKVNLNKVSDILAALQSAQKNAVLVEDFPADRSEYGLDNPIYTLSLTSGGADISVLFGLTEGGSCYAAREDIDAVIAIPVENLSFLYTTENDILSPDFLLNIPEKISYVKATIGQKTYGLNVNIVPDKPEDSYISYNGFSLSSKILSDALNYLSKKSFEVIESVYIEKPDLTAVVSLKSGQNYNFAVSSLDDGRYLVVLTENNTGFYLSSDDYNYFSELLLSD